MRRQVAYFCAAQWPGFAPPLTELETNRAMSLFEVYSSLVHRDLFERQSEDGNNVPNRRTLKS